MQQMLDRWTGRGREWHTDPYYPAVLRLAERNCLVVGAGSVGHEKIQGLLAADALVKVVAKKATDKVRQLAEEGMIELVFRPYTSTDLNGCFLVIAATEDAKTNECVYEDAEKLGMLCNVVDAPSLCNFILPSVHRNNDLIITISTGGASPALARKLRHEVSNSYGDEHADALKILGALRAELKQRYPDYRDRKIVFERIVYSDLLDWVRESQIDAIEEWVSRCIEDGPAYTSYEDHCKIVESALSTRQAVSDSQAD